MKKEEKEYRRKHPHFGGYLGESFYSHFITYLRKMVSDGKLTLEDIGTREETLEQVQTIPGDPTTLYQWFWRLSIGIELLDSFLIYLHRELQKQGLTLKKAGIDERELKKLLRLLKKLK